MVAGGGGSDNDSAEPEQTESLNENTGGEDTGEYAPNEESRGTSGTGEIDLSKITADYIAHDGETLTGTLGANVKISIADGATVTIRDVTINGEKNESYRWAGISCEGDAVINLAGANSVTGFYNDYPGIHVPKDKTLTIKGSGALNASSNGQGAGIGGGFAISCGNIVIESGTITATGGRYAAGIGGGGYAMCGNITITGGIGTAKRGEGGISPAWKKIFPDSIGAGLLGSCGKVTIYDKEGAISEESYTYPKNMTDLSTFTADYTAHDGETLTGTLGANVKVSIADGATVDLWNVTINGTNNEAYKWAGITCEGDATIILIGINSVKGFYLEYPGIHVKKDKTLTIKGDGKLTASSNGQGAGIGGGYQIPCGNIVIESGTINAFGGDLAAGIGTGAVESTTSCGHITINGGKITATKGRESSYSVGQGHGARYTTEITICGGKYIANEDTFRYGFEPNTEGSFTVDIDTAAGYAVYSMALYGRKCLGLNEDGSYKLSGWEIVQEWTTAGEWWKHIRSQGFSVARKYVELGFQFDIKSRPSYVFSKPFWPDPKKPERKNERIDKVFIDIGGELYTANITIKVNDATVVEEYNCYTETLYDWR